MPWSGFQIAWKCIHQHQRVIILIDPVNLHLVNTKIRHHHKLLVRCHTDAADMWTEHTLCHTSQSLMVNTGCDAADASIWIQIHNRCLTIMVSCHEQVFSIWINGKLTTPHSFNIGCI